MEESDASFGAWTFSLTLGPISAVAIIHRWTIIGHLVRLLQARISRGCTRRSPPFDCRNIEDRPAFKSPMMNSRSASNGTSSFNSLKLTSRPTSCYLRLYVKSSAVVAERCDADQFVLGFGFRCLILTLVS